MTIIICLIMIFLLVTLAYYYMYEKEDKIEDSKITHFVKLKHDSKFGGIELEYNGEQFHKYGFDYGDSLNIKFSNEQTLTDVPFYNGYYVKPNENIIVSYKGNGKVKICQNSGLDLWNYHGLTEMDSVTISINEKGKYLETQKMFDLVYSDNPDDFSSPEMFANFRRTPIKNVYRGTNLLYNKFNRAQTASNLCKQNKINFILNLSDNENDLTDYAKRYPSIDSSYFYKLYKKNKVALLDMSAAYRENVFKEKLGKGLIQMIKYKGPYYIQCIEGKDRTGFVCLLLELLCGYSYEDCKKDYMESYNNYFGITEESDKTRYDAIVKLHFDEMYDYLGENCNFTDTEDAAEEYLKQCGLTLKQIDKLKQRITE